jgi:hypothetical protein
MENMMEINHNLFELLPQEIAKSLEAMSKTDDVGKKRIYSEIVRNLCISLGVFFNAMEEEADEDDLFDTDEEFNEF